MSFPSSSATLFAPDPNHHFPASESHSFVNEDNEAPTIRMQIPAEPSHTFEEQKAQLWKDLHHFYAENEDKIQASLGVEGWATGDKGMNLDVALDGFMQTANVVLEGLVVLANVHPVLGVAIFAFHGIVKMDIARRNNDKKVLAVVLQMQDTMSAMFELRNLKASLYEAARNEEKSSLQRLCELVAQNITSCRSDLAYYSKRQFVSKLIKSKGYEQMFTDHILTFTQRRSELQMLIATYTVNGIENARLAIIDVGEKMDGLDRKIEAMIFEIFRKLDTSREKKSLDFLNSNGGPQKCVESPDLLRKLMSACGEPVAAEKSSQDDFATLQKSLKEELSSDLKQTLQKNQARFERLLNVQNNNLKRISEQMEDQGQMMYNHSSKLGEILTKVNTVMVYEEGRFTKKAVKLKDPEIQQVWERMGLDRRSVKAKHFVLTFRDHILTGYSMPSTPHTSHHIELHSEDMSNLLFSTSAPSPGGLQVSINEISTAQDNRWLLEYIDASYVQPIIEAMDDDGSGFISVQEASKFALSRPKDLTLLHWMAYWAAGWHLNIANYQWNIYSVLTEMHETLPSIHIANRSYVDDYMGDLTFRRVETLLRSIRALPDSAGREPKLCNISTSVANAQLKRLEANLKEMSFLLESAPDVVEIGGEGKVETWILPLLYLVLKRHLAIMKLGRKVVLHPEELTTHTNSLDSIFYVFDERMRNLEAKFRQVHRDVDAQFATFAYGMFFTSFKKKEFAVAENTTMNYHPINTYFHSLITEDFYLEPEATASPTILAKPRGPTFAFREDGTDNTSTPPNHSTHPLEGYWTLYRRFRAPGASHPAPIMLNMYPVTENKIIGTGKNFYASGNITGDFTPTEGDEAFPVSFKLYSENEYMRFAFEGHYWPEDDCIKGNWYTPSSDASQEIETPLLAVEKPKVEKKTTCNDEEHDTAFAPANLEDQTTAKESTEDGALLEKSHTEPLEAVNQSIDADKLDNISRDIGAMDEVNPEDFKADDSSQTTDSTDTGMVVQTDETASITDSTDSTSEEPVAADEMYTTGLFILRRTPPDVIRFRRWLDGPAPESEPAWKEWSESRKRWAFAIAAVMERTRNRRGSVELFYERLAERRRWVELSIRLELSDKWSDYSYHRTFSAEAAAEWATLLESVHPQVARVYEEISQYYLQREIYQMGSNFCDTCRRIIIFDRFQCITCVREDMNNQVDLCTDCYIKPTVSKFDFNNDFAHKLSHSLIRSTRFIHKYQLAYIIPNERKWSQTLKKRFQGIEMKNDLTNERENKALKGIDEISPNKALDEPPPKCGSCDKEIVLPCYVCVQCVLFFICLDCQRNHLPLRKESAAYRTHTNGHPLLRIHDSKEVRTTKSEYDRLEQQLEDMEVRINEKFTGGLLLLEHKLARKLRQPNAILLAAESHQDGEYMVEELNNQPEETLSDVGSDAVDPDITDDTPEDIAAESQGVPDQSTSVSETIGSKLASLVAGLKSLESKVDKLANDIQVQPEDRITALENKVDALEAKVDTQYGVLISLLQQLVPPLNVNV